MAESQAALAAAGAPAFDDDVHRAAYTASRMAQWDRVARSLGRVDRWNRAYHHRLQERYRWLIPAGRHVLEIGCGTGDLLAAVEPAVGVGVDFSAGMLSVAHQRHPHLRFVRDDAHDLDLGGTFDYIILSDVINDVWDVQRVFERVRRHSAPHTRIVLNIHSHLWALPLRIVKALGLSRPMLEQSWLTVDDVANLLRLADCEIVQQSTEVLWPFATPGIAALCNRWLAKMWPFSIGALTHMLVARPFGEARPAAPRVSVVVPARNEAGNVPHIFARVPEMGAGTELIFVEGHSSDDTFGAIQSHIERHPEHPAILLRQSGEGKGDAVREGFARASGDMLMILDADLTVAPEDLPRFYAALVGGKGDMVNGVRLVYPMDDRAMRFFNLLGNKFFSLLFSWLLGQTIKDTLCGTKVLWRCDYERIAAARAYFGDFDPFGDFDLLFGASKLSLKIIEMPVRYRRRTYGETQIQRWRHGALLLRMSAIALRKLRFV
jgi:ubiquinone/menaquinone biosynthesis C-methylase UbiE